MPSKAKVENAILEREGFRIDFEMLGKKQELPSYDFPVMAPHRWKVSDWKNTRLEAYNPFIKAVTVYAGDGEPVCCDMMLGKLRDTYYEDAYGSLEPRLANEQAGLAGETGMPPQRIAVPRNRLG